MIAKVMQRRLCHLASAVLANCPDGLFVLHAAVCLPLVGLCYISMSTVFQLFQQLASELVPGDME